MIHTKPTKYAWYPTGESLTEQEHKKSCDVNLMLAAAARGQAIATRPIGQWDDSGVDDMSMDRLQLEIQKQELSEALAESAKTELPEEALNLIPEGIRKKFGFRAQKKSAQGQPKNNDLNDDKTAGNADDKKAQNKAE